MKKIISSITVALPLLFISAVITGCGDANNAMDNIQEPVTGLIFSMQENEILVVEGISDANIDSDEWFQAGKRAVYFKIDDETIIESRGENVSKNILAKGQKVMVWPKDGDLFESYPEQGKAERIVIVKD